MIYPWLCICSGAKPGTMVYKSSAIFIKRMEITEKIFSHGFKTSTESTCCKADTVTYFFFILYPKMENFID